ncbi:AAA family ATPase [Spirosoma soli]|uniref:AAA family ATPase n=1 Tax=Spirosoma soli TaxID=1770529 RepID=A0ABW5M9T2_9BACT
MFENITRDHIIKALEKKGPMYLPAGEYFVYERKKYYQPYNVVKLAYQYANPDAQVPDIDSNQALKLLKRLGFYTRKATTQATELEQQTDTSSFTWVPFYQEMCPKLLQYTPSELIGFIKQVLSVQNQVGLKDKDAEGNVFDLADMDPYTFLSFLNKTGDAKRLASLGLLKDIMNLTAPAPTDVRGLPSSQAQSVWMFGYSFIRKPEDISQLRTLYKQVEDGGLSDSQFQRVLQIYKVGPAKLTESMFCQKPTSYLPINSQTKPWLKKRGLPFRYETLVDYWKLLKAVREHDSRHFYEISWEAYLENNTLKELQKDQSKYYCVGVTFRPEHGGDQLPRFIEEGIWQNGYKDTQDRYKEIVKKIPVGSKLAAKSTFTQGPNRSISVLKIRAIGEVVANPGDGLFLDVIWDEDFEPFSINGKGSYQATVKEVTSLEDIQLIFFHQPDQPTETMPEPSSHPKNIILYGPPGTGKTYETIDLAVEIVDGPNNNNHPTNKQRFDQLRKESQIEFITFHQNYTYEDFITGLKPATDGGELKFEQRYGVFYRMAKLARDNYNATRVSKGNSTLKPFYEVIEDVLGPLIFSDTPVPVSMPSGKSYLLTEVTNNSIKFSKSNGNQDHSLSTATLEGLYEGTIAFPTGGMRTYYKPLVELLRTKGKVEGPTTTPLKNYVLVIDEINRANMSRVFGELITLLEDDKRLGGDNELTVTLPSGELFSVPPNMYLIGTMNTADKSLALLDIALRRRFEFIVKNPNYTVLNDPAKSLLEQLNRSIIKHKKSADFQIGHAYFINKSAEQINSVLDNRVIPLLLEYFNGRTDMVEKVLAEAQIPFHKDDLTLQFEARYGAAV